MAQDPAQLSANARTIASYEQAAQLYREHHRDEPWAERDAFLESIAERVPGGRVLELGSGPGTDARRMEALGLDVERTDATHAFVDLLRADGYEARVLNAITDDFGGPYDAVYASAMLLHLPVPDLRAVLRKARAAAGWHVESLEHVAGRRDDWLQVLAT